MIARIRSRALWVAVGLSLAGGAFAMAGVPDIEDTGNEISDLAKLDPSSVSDAASAKDESAENEKGKQKSAEARAQKAAKVHNGERKHNHGFFVSQAAHCEDVSEGEFDFNAPGDCDTNGEAHGEYVSGVAESDIGKKESGD